MSFLATLFHDESITAEFSAAQTIAYMLEFEKALAGAQGQMGIISAEAAQQIVATIQDFEPDIEAIQVGMAKSSVPTIELIKQVRGAIGAEHGSYVHWGATSQDVMDTALVLQLRACIIYLESVLQKTIINFAKIADRHRQTLMVGRTHSQHALPISFGFKVANWIMPLVRHQQRLAELKPRLLVLQCGGAVGTLAALGNDGQAVTERVAQHLQLGVPITAWHTQRDNLAEFGAWLSLVTGSLAKIAQDIILMAQSEIAEVLESNDPTRGGSSTMPQKRNPIISELIVAAARQNANLLASLHQAMIQEHERATGNWQIEWLAIPQMLHLTATALNKAHFLSENLVVNVDQMRHHVDASNGLLLAEAIDLALSPMLGRTEAKKIVKACVAVALAEQQHLVDVVRQQVTVDVDWDSLRDERDYLGQSDELINRVLEQVRQSATSDEANI